MTKTLISIATWAILGWLAGLWLGAATGWGVFSVGLLIMVLVSGVQLSQISRWVKTINAPPPPSVGPWDEILAPIYRTLKRYRSDQARLHDTLGSVMAAVEALPDGTVLLNADMELVWCNQTASNHLGLNTLTDRHHNIINIFRVPEFARYVRQEEWPSPLLIHTHYNGNTRALLINMTRYGPEDFLLVTRDVTQIEKLETMRRDFIANVSHELRTPLTVLAGFLETLDETPADAVSDEQRAHYLNLMREQANRMQAIISDLLTLSTLESQPQGDGEPLNMTDIIRASLDQARALSAGRHEFKTDIDANLHITGMANELTSAISNLINNAVHYTPPPGTITVEWKRKPDGTALFAVTDTGIGVATKDIPRLTERFYRVDHSRSRATGGTGLGLAITRHVALRHDGELKVDSRLGAGSRFSIVFPARRIVAGLPDASDA